MKCGRGFPERKYHGAEKKKIGTGVASLIPMMTCKENFIGTKSMRMRVGRSTRQKL